MRKSRPIWPVHLYAWIGPMERWRHWWLMSDEACNRTFLSASSSRAPIPPKRVENQFGGFPVIRETLNIIWTYSEHTLSILWTCSEHALNILWTYSEHTLSIPWSYSDHTLNIPWTVNNVHWTYPKRTLKIAWWYAQDLTRSQKHYSLTVHRNLLQGHADFTKCSNTCDSECSHNVVGM